MQLADIRTDYHQGQLHRRDLAANPVTQFDRWMADALRAKLVDPTAMTLATVGADGRPRARTVLLKGVDARGFVFYTNLESRKGQQLAENAEVALLFPWLALERQVLVQGRAERVPDDEARAYFQSRPRESQLGAWASPQSQPITARGDLEAALAQVQDRFGVEGKEPLPLPPFWGGYRVRHRVVEFWQGGANRLHDRFEYRRAGEGSDGSGGDDNVWLVGRLAP